MSAENIRREGVRRADRKDDRNRWVYPLIAVFVCMFLSVGVNLVYTTIAIRHDEQNWCDLIISLDERYSKLHSTDPAAIDFGTKMHILRQKFECK